MMSRPMGSPGLRLCANRAASRRAFMAGVWSSARADDCCRAREAKAALARL